MANIDKELEAIQNAVYGEEVRSSIYNGIKAVNDSAVGSAQVCVTKAEEASSSAANAESSASSATTKATESEQSATMARSYATSGTGAREGEDVDNAKYYMEQAMKKLILNIHQQWEQENLQHHLRVFCQHLTDVIVKRNHKE